MADFVLSDDLTGASGVASMVDGSLAVTVSLSRFKPSLADEFPFIAISLESRDEDDEKAVHLAEDALEHIGRSWTALRIDSALRGNVRGMVGKLSERGRVLVTDTIPEYGRYTKGGKTYVDNQGRDLNALLETVPGGRVVVADSETVADLSALASRCTREGMIPADPGPLVSLVVKDRLRFSGKVPKSHERGGGSPIEKVAFVIGTRDGMTLKQLRHIELEGFIVRPPKSEEAAEVSIFAFSLDNEARLVDDSFVDSLRDYDAIVLSGGATASFVLDKSRFDCIVNGAQVQPLLSTGTVRGGILDGTLVVLKGGFIGDEKTYKTILEWLKQR